MNEQAKMLANIIRLQSSNMNEAMMLVADAVKILAETEDKKEVPMVHKEVPPTKEEPKPKVIKSPNTPVYAKPGHICKCDDCGKEIYKVNAKIVDGMEIPEFIKAFIPLGHEITINPEWPYQNIDGCMMTRCPLCKSDEGLVLWGNRPLRDKGIKLGTNVTTLSDEEIRSL